MFLRPATKFVFYLYVWCITLCDILSHCAVMTSAPAVCCVFLTPLRNNIYNFMCVWMCVAHTHFCALLCVCLFKMERVWLLRWCFSSCCFKPQTFFLLLPLSLLLRVPKYRVNGKDYSAWWHFILRSNSEKSNLFSLQGPVEQRMTNHSMR